MSGPDGVLMGRAELERAFTRLGEWLVRRGVVADIFVVGGAAMALAYDAKRVTRDVDAMFVPHGVVLDEARAVADGLGLPPWWLNQQINRVPHIMATDQHMGYPPGQRVSPPLCSWQIVGGGGGGGDGARSRYAPATIGTASTPSPSAMTR